MNNLDFRGILVVNTSYFLNMKKVLIIVGAVIGVLILVVVLIVAYLGFVPGLSNFFIKAKDLGVPYSREVALKVFEDIGFEPDLGDELPIAAGSEDLTFDGSIDIDVSLSSEEITSVVNSFGDSLEEFPLSDVQIKFEGDTTEFSAMVDIGKAIEAAKELGYTDEEISQAKGYVAIINNNISVYGKGVSSINNNELNIDSTASRIGNVNVPEDLVGMIEEVAADAIEKRLYLIPQMDIRSAVVEDGQLMLDATVPQKVTY